MNGHDPKPRRREPDRPRGEPATLADALGALAERAPAARDAPADATRTRRPEPKRHPEMRAVERSGVEDFLHALVTTAAEYVNLGQKPIQSPRHKRERMLARMEAGNLNATRQDLLGSREAQVGEALAHVLPALFLTRGAPISPAAYRGGASLGQAVAGGWLGPNAAGVIATDPTMREEFVRPLKRLVRR
jgi:hypothetical protein